jgi:hypothetical protein
LEVVFAKERIYEQKKFCYHHTKVLEIPIGIEKISITLKLYNYRSKELERICCEKVLSKPNAIFYRNTKLLEKASCNSREEIQNERHHHYSKVLPRIRGGKKISSASMGNSYIAKELEVSTRTKDKI